MITRKILEKAAKINNVNLVAMKTSLVLMLSLFVFASFGSQAYSREASWSGYSSNIQHNYKQDSYIYYYVPVYYDPYIKQSVYYNYAVAVKDYHPESLSQFPPVADNSHQQRPKQDDASSYPLYFD